MVPRFGPERRLARLPRRGPLLPHPAPVGDRYGAAVLLGIVALFLALLAVGFTPAGAWLVNPPW